jgi:hypothetical protein
LQKTFDSVVDKSETPVSFALTAGALHVWDRCVKESARRLSGTDVRRDNLSPGQPHQSFSMRVNMEECAQESSGCEEAGFCEQLLWNLS